MAVQLSTTVRDAMLDQIETTIGSASITLNIFTGAQPTNTTEANSGTLLASMSLPTNWMDNASGGSKSKSAGTWEDTSADAAGTAAHFRIHATNTCHLQGSVGQGSGDLSLDNTTIAAGQQITITTFTLTAGNA